MENIKKNIENENIQISFKINGKTFIYPESVLDIIKLYKGEMSYDKFEEKNKNNENISIIDGFIIISLINNNKVYLNYDGFKYYIMKSDNNLTLEVFLEDCKKGDLDIERKNEIACILHFLENENNVDNLKTLIELQNVGNIQKNPETKSVVEGNKGEVGEILESKNNSFEVAGEISNGVKDGKGNKKTTNIINYHLEAELNKINKRLNTILEAINENKRINDFVINELKEYQRFLVESIKIYEKENNIEKIKEIIEIFEKLKNIKKLLGEKTEMIEQFITSIKNKYNF